jgi:hypothetical protein
MLTDISLEIIRNAGAARFDGHPPRPATGLCTAPKKLDSWPLT